MSSGEINLGDPQGPAVEVRATQNVASVPPRPDVLSAKWYKNPFVVAFIAGAITLTWLQARLRYRPEAPPVMGQISTEGWTDAEGATISASPFDGQVTLVSFASPEYPAGCGAATLMSKLWYMFDDSPYPVHFATVGLSTGDDKAWARFEHAAGSRAGWWFAGPSTEDAVSGLTTTLISAGEAMAAWRVDEPRPPARFEAPAAPICDGPAALGQVALVDDQGAIRGVFDAHAWDIESEIFHRAQHVLELGAAD